MKSNTLQIGKALSAALFVLLLCAAGMTKMYAYDFSAVCSTGQTLYYNIINANHSVALTYPGNSTSSPWEGFTKPTGNITLPDSVTYNGVTYPVIQIGNYAFYECSSMTGSLTFPPSVKWIGNYAFYGCNGFTGNLTIPNSVTSIGRYAFNNCNGFTEVQYYANNCSTNGYSYVDYNFNQWIWCPPFIGCTGSLTIGNNIETIPAHMFRGGSFTGNLNIPNSVTSIGTSAFSNCSGFTGSLTIPHSIASIGTVAFSNCSGFTGVIFNATNCVDLSSSSTYTHPSPFYGCGGTLIIGDNVEKIPAYMFDWCSGFTGNLTIPNSVTSIGNYAFSGCSGFTGSLTIPNSVTSIGNSAFSRCSGFTDSLTIGNSVTSIGNSAFSRCSGFTGSLTIGNSVTMIDDYTFYTCNGFTGSLIIPNSVTSIGSNAFAYCSGFTDSLTIGNSVTLIEGRAFDNCSGFTDCLTIGNSVTTIDGYAFYNCSGFTSMNSLAETPPSVGSSTFYLVNHSMPVTVPCGTIGTYQSASGWSQFTNYIEDCSLHITATANPFEGGTVIGAGTFEEGDTCTLVATPNEGYDFENWTKEGNIVSDNTTYSFMVTEDAAFVANFIEHITIDTTIYAEICQGNNYLQDGFEIYNPEVGEHEYSITLLSSQGIDSIVNLTLTVHPTYFFEEDTTLCNTASFEWRGHTYTESGIYYDSLQTVQGCDSIFQLSLELFNMPLGEFASMTPTNNYPFTSLPITFSWDAVSGAEYYNLYLWNTNDPVPSTPFAGNIYNRSCYVSSLQNHQTYNWYVEAVNTCFSSTSSVRSFSLNIPPSMNVSTNSLAFGEVVLNDSVSMNMFVRGNALDDAITLQITGEDASMFSFEQVSNWNGLTGGSLTVTFSPKAIQYNYTANLVITTGTLTQTVQLTGSLADMFVFNTYVTQDVFEMNSTIPIYGTVTDVNNNPMAGAEVEVKVKVMGTTRSLFATTGDVGHFSVDFVPAYSESGYYTINSGRVGHNSTAVHDDFNIPGMNLVTNGWILWDVVQNETTTGSIVIRNRSQIPLTNIQVAATTLPEGCSFTFQPLSLQGMEEGVLEYSVTGSALTSGNNYEEVRLVATSAEGATMNFSAWYYCAEPRGILYASPNNITTTMTKGINKIVDVMLYNNGTGPTGSVYLDIPSVDWLSVIGNDTLPSIAVHDSAYFSLRLSANEDTPLVQYTGNIAVNCERGDGLLLPYTIMAVSDSTGTLIVDVTDDYTYNGNGQHLAGATVTVKGYYSLETVAIGLTDSNGLFTVNNIPEGYYRMSITAPNHAEYQATIQIEGGQTNMQNIYLQYQAITYSWNVVPTEIEDEYTFELIVDYETNVPVPVVVIDMPQTFPELEEGESYVFDYIITNYGLVDTYDATLYPPTGHPLYDFTPLITEIDTLHAQSTMVIPCTMTRRTASRSQAVWETLGKGGNREEMECPYSALTQTKQYYICGDRENWIWANVWRNIGGYACETVPYTPAPGAPIGGGGGSGGGGASSSSSSTPAVTTQNNDCDFDPCLSGVKEDIDNCDNNGSGTPPALPPKNPANNR